MNQLDIKNNTRLVAISNVFISADKVKQGAKVCMGTDESALFDIVSEKVIPLLILVNKEEYFKIKNDA